MKRDPLFDSFYNRLQGEVDSDRPMGLYSAMISWIKVYSLHESFFAIRHSVIMSRLEEHRLFTAKCRDCHPSNTRLASASKAAQRRNEDAQDELREWKKEARQPLSHRQRDLTRQPIPRRDYAEYCTRLLTETGELWHEAWEIYVYAEEHISPAHRDYPAPSSLLRNSKISVLSYDTGDVNED